MLTSIIMLSICNCYGHATAVVVADCAIGVDAIGNATIFLTFLFVCFINELVLDSGTYPIE